MTEVEWLFASEPSTMVAFFQGNVSDRKLRLFACACCRSVWNLLPDGSERSAIQVAEDAADGLVDTSSQQLLLREIGPRANTQYGIFTCGGSRGPGSTYAAMAATATLSGNLTFALYMGQSPSEGYTAWECAAMSRAQEAKEEVREQHWQAWVAACSESEDEPGDDWHEQTSDVADEAWDRELATALSEHCALLRDIFGNPFRPVVVGSSWLTSDVLALASGIYQDRAFDRMPILADALQDAGCDNDDILNHCRQPGEHVRGCWVVDLLLGKK